MTRWMRLSLRLSLLVLRNRFSHSNMFVLFLSFSAYAEIPEWFVDVDGRDLGLWVADRRREWNAGQLSVKEVAALNNICSFWKLAESKREQPQLNLPWESWLESLESFQQAYDTTLVPKWYRDPYGKNLGYWVAKQRVKKSNGTLGQKRIDDLDDRGFIWNV